jgi:hypothetical protein
MEDPKVWKPGDLLVATERNDGRYDFAPGDIVCFERNVSEDAVCFDDYGEYQVPARGFSLLETAADMDARLERERQDIEPMLYALLNAGYTLESLAASERAPTRLRMDARHRLEELQAEKFKPDPNEGPQPGDIKKDGQDTYVYARGSECNLSSVDGPVIKLETDDKPRIDMPEETNRARLSSVEEAELLLAGNIQALRDSVKDLSAKLEPVKRIEPRAEGNAAKVADPHHSPLSDKLSGFAYEIETIMIRVREITNLVEL